MQTTAPAAMPFFDKTIRYVCVCVCFIRFQCSRHMYGVQRFWLQKCKQFNRFYCMHLQIYTHRTCTVPQTLKHTCSWISFAPLVQKVSFFYFLFFYNSLLLACINQLVCYSSRSSVFVLSVGLFDQQKSQ